MLALVFVNVVINYLDRSNISVAGAMLSKDLNLSSVQLGLIFSAFGWTYALMQIPAGGRPLWPANPIRLLPHYLVAGNALSGICARIHVAFFVAAGDRGF